MKLTPLQIIALTISSAAFTQAAPITWTTTPGVADTEVTTTGNFVYGYYFSSNAGRPATVNVNSVPFTLWVNGGAAPAGLNFNGSYNNPEDVDCYQVPLTAANTGLNQILDGQNWGGAQALTMTGLTPGQQYLVQFMIADDRPAFLNNRNYDVSDGNDPFASRDVINAFHSTQGGGVPPAAVPGSREAKVFNGVFTADGTGNQDIWNWLYENTASDHNSATNSGSQVNAIQVRAIPEPAAISLGLAAAGLLALRRRRA